MFSTTALRLNYMDKTCTRLSLKGNIFKYVYWHTILHMKHLSAIVYSLYKKSWKEWIFTVWILIAPPPKKITYLGTRRGLLGTCFLCTECITYLQILTLERGSTWYSRIRMVWTNGESRTCRDSWLNTFLSRVCATRNPGSGMTLRLLVFLPREIKQKWR